MPRSPATPSPPDPDRPRAKDVTSYDKAVAFLESHINVERLRTIRSLGETFKLGRMRALLEELGDPHLAVPMVHVAGSKGKGSTTAMIASMLQGCGMGVGAYTSPHLVDVRERVRINGVMMERAAFADIMRRVAEATERLEPGEPLHFFEVLTALAFVHFADQAVDAAVIEVGLGGRLDSTNVIEPIACAITPISHEHTAILGSTLDAIAREKAGILKPGVPTAVAAQEPEAETAIRDVAASVGAPVWVLDREISFRAVYDGPSGRRRVLVDVVGPGVDLERVECPLLGEHQGANAALALAVIGLLRERGWNLPDEGVLAGLAETVVEGRMEVVARGPTVLLDGAHNGSSMAALMRAIGAHFDHDALIVIFGCAADKDVDGMMRALSQAADKVVFTRARSNPRALMPEALLERYQALTGRTGQTAEDFVAALDLARRAAGPRDLICVTGSLYLVGDARGDLIGRDGPGFHRPRR